MEQQNLINGCIAVEEAAASLYRTFMDLFPGEKSFWQELHSDELEHAAMLSNSAYTEAIDLLPSQDMLPSVEQIERALDFTGKRNEFIKANPVTFEEALKTAHRLEESMVEIFANELLANLLAKDYESLSRKLFQAEKIHIDKIEGMMLKMGFLQLS
ncbi:MAG: hypothetical protein C4526_10150 [Nitrospiraceae bacterium]|nr:MAG: hypothetical protein C4526_10150 [Nitrospiraceae bacterium]